MQVAISENRALNDAATNDDTSTVGEPSVATNHDRAFFTGNWYAGRTTDSGVTFSYVDPANTTTPAAGGFCCDQLTLYDPERRIWIWIIQYIRAGLSNVFRIAVLRDADFTDDGGWYWWDIAPATLDPSWTDIWFDYPDAALGSEHLYVTFNAFTGDAFRRSAVMKFPLATLADGGSLGFSWWSTEEFGSLRLTQQATPGDDMFYASHANTSRLRLWSWPGSSGSISSWNVDVNLWSRNISSIAPNGVDWLGRADPRITGGTLGGEEITFMWTAGADGDHPNAYCRVVTIDRNSKAVTGQPDIWSTSRAWAYPATCVNDEGTLGAAAFYGGNGRNPGHVVLARDGNSWRAAYSKLGSDSPAEPVWGDYINCRADVPNGGSWVASGFTLEGGSSRTDIVPRMVRYALVP